MPSLPTMDPIQITISIVTGILAILAAYLGLRKARQELTEQSKQIEEQHRLINAQKLNIESLAKAFHSLQALRAALVKPLEGVWAARLNYQKFHGEDSPRFYLVGVAIFLWRGDVSPRGYDIYFSGHVCKEPETSHLIASMSKLSLFTDESGIPAEPFEVKGKYLSRSASDPIFKVPANFDYFRYTNGRLKTDKGGTIIEQTLEFDSGRSRGVLTLARQ